MALIIIFFARVLRAALPYFASTFPTRAPCTLSITPCRKTSIDNVNRNQVGSSAILPGMRVRAEASRVMRGVAIIIAGSAARAAAPGGKSTEVRQNTYWHQPSGSEPFLFLEI